MAVSMRESQRAAGKLQVSSLHGASLAKAAIYGGGEDPAPTAYSSTRSQDSSRTSTDRESVDPWSQSQVSSQAPWWTGPPPAMQMFGAKVGMNRARCQPQPRSAERLPPMADHIQAQAQEIRRRFQDEAFQALQGAQAERESHQHYGMELQACAQADRDTRQHYGMERQAERPCLPLPQHYNHQVQLPALNEGHEGFEQSRHGPFEQRPREPSRDPREQPPAQQPMAAQQAFPEIHNAASEEVDESDPYWETRAIADQTRTKSYGLGIFPEEESQKQVSPADPLRVPNGVPNGTDHEAAFFYDQAGRPCVNIQPQDEYARMRNRGQEHGRHFDRSGSRSLPPVPNRPVVAEGASTVPAAFAEAGRTYEEMARLRELVQERNRGIVGNIVSARGMHSHQAPTRHDLMSATRTFSNEEANQVLEQVRAARDIAQARNSTDTTHLTTFLGGNSVPQRNAVPSVLSGFSREEAEMSMAQARHGRDMSYARNENDTSRITSFGVAEQHRRGDIPSVLSGFTNEEAAAVAADRDRAREVAFARNVRDTRDITAFNPHDPGCMGSIASTPYGQSKTMPAQERGAAAVLAGFSLESAAQCGTDVRRGRGMAHVRNAFGSGAAFCVGSDQPPPPRRGGPNIICWDGVRR